MSINLLDIAKSYLTNAVVEKLSGSVGESASSTQKALAGILPALMGGVVNKASDTQGAAGLLDMLKGHDGSMLDNLGSVLGGDNNSLLSAGSGIVSSLLGDKTSGVVDSISAFSGIKKESSSSLLSMAAPLLMGVIGKKVGSDGLGAAGLASLLSSQKDNIQAALPSGFNLGSLGGILGLSGLAGGIGNLTGGVTNLASSAGKTVSNVTDSARRQAEEIAEEAGGGMPKWLLPLLGLLAVAALIWYLMKGCNGDKVADATAALADSTVAVVEASTDSLASGVAAVADSAGGAVKEAIAGLGSFFKKKLPDGTELNIPEMGIENKLVNFIEDKSKAVDKRTWFSFDRLDFETGKSILKPASQEQLQNIAAILKAYPAVNIKLGGYTDNTGNPASNLKLSQSRANAAQAELVKLGVPAGRLAAEGYGDKNPVADNATAEGRQKNRRIDVNVTKK